MSLFVSSLSNMIGDSHGAKEDELINFRQVNIGTYSKTYIFLKAQKTILENVLQSITQIRNETKSSELDFIEYLVECLLMTDFGNIFQQAKNAIPSLRAFVEGDRLPLGIRKIGQRLLSASIALSRVFSIIECILPSTSSDDESAIKEKSVQKDPLRMEDILVLCRICEEYVPLSLIESHSNSCVRAYETEYKIISVDERIAKLQNSIRKMILCENWPGEERKCVGTYLPMFHLVLLLDKVRNANTSSQRDAEIISMINQSIKKIQTPPDQNAESMLSKAKELTIQKLYACSTLTDVTNILQQTRVSGNDQAFTPKVTIADFEFVKSISSGAYARVFLGIKKKTGDIYAIKVTSRSSLAQKNQMQRLITEKDILLQNDNPHIVNFYYSIIGVHNLYLVMEYLPGGDLFSLLNTLGSIDEENTRIYTVQIVKALQCLHDLDIVHRDLKPDNILITKDGKLKLTDFGLSLFGTADRCINDETNSAIEKDNESVVGTPDYLPPEIILSQPHDCTADYWSLGIVIFELVEGIPPFHRNTEVETFSAILSNNINWEDYDFSPELTDLLKKLLESDPKKRLGANGIEEIMNHPWFASIDWNNIDVLVPPFVPEINDKLSTEYFDQRYAWKTEDDHDIIEDIKAAREGCEESNNGDLDEDIAAFPSVDFKKLSQTNKELVKKMKKKRARANSDFDSTNSDFELEGSLSVSRSFSTIDSDSRNEPK